MNEEEYTLPSAKLIQAELKREKNRRRFWKIIKNTISTLIIIAAIAVLTAIRKKTKLRVEWLCVLGAGAVLSAGALVGSPQIADRSFTALIVLLTAMLLTVMADRKPASDRRSVYVGAALVVVCVLAGVYALGEVRAHGSAWMQQVAAMEQAAAAGDDVAVVSSVPSSSRYTMDIVLSPEPSVWPNSSLGKYYGVRIVGE